MSAFKGAGTPASPFSSKVRDILRVLIRNPRASLADIKRQLSGKTPNIAALTAHNLEAGALADALRFRLAVRPLRYNSSADERHTCGTCFVEVKLNATTEEALAQFEADVRSIKGVIEWDLISGDDVDYLIRVSGRQGDDLAIKHRTNISKLANVQKVWMSKIQIWRSGIVDNFEPDDFLSIKITD